ncbi:hypothetical protein [Streptomyces sp. ADI96-02]|nr:hypothetical protein [Streptomyces sp. ADI96-02]
MVGHSSGKTGKKAAVTKGAISVKNPVKGNTSSVKVEIHSAHLGK